MEIYANVFNFESLSNECGKIGNILDAVILQYSTVSYEIINDMESENADELKSAADEIKKLLDEGYIAIKKHENFLINACMEYDDTDRCLSDEALSIENNLYNGSSSYNSAVVIPTTEILPFLNPYITPLIADNLPKSDISGINIKNNEKSIIITDLNDAIIFGSDKYADYYRVIMGVIGLIVPGAIITGIYNLLPIDRIIDHFGGSEESDDENNNISGTFGSNYDQFVDIVGNAFQTNYNHIEALLFDLIISSIINGSIFVAEIGKYETLSDIKYSTPISGNDNEEDAEEEQTESVEKFDNNKDNDNNLDDYKDTENGEITWDDNEEKNSTKTNNDLIYEDSPLHESGIRNNDENDVFPSSGIPNNIEEADKIVAENAKQINFEKLPDVAEKINDTMDSKASSSGRGSYSSGGYGGGTIGAGSSLSGVATSSNSGIDSVTDNTYNSEELRSKTDYEAKYEKSSSLYDRILSAEAYRKSTSFGKREKSAIGAGLAALGGFGGIGGIGAMAQFETNSLAGENKNMVLNHIIGAMNFSNIFDLIGNAQICNLDWLSELTNIFD